MNPFIFAISKYFINKYNQLWIPDEEGDNNLSGDLSHTYFIKDKTKFIGILSRFHKTKYDIKDYKYDVCCIISGPEPQRTNLYNLLYNEIIKTSLKVVIIAGKPDENMNPKEFANGRIYPHLNKEKMQEIIEESAVVISRSGYSTIMDLSILGKQAIFIPTPGQTEQEYLAKLLMKKGLIYYQKQKYFNLQKALDEIKNYKGLGLDYKSQLAVKNNETLITEIKKLLS
jgi:uncharacterized protein (TIGR00661 family)